MSLSALETLIVNDKNLEMALEADVLTTLTSIVKNLSMNTVQQ